MSDSPKPKIISAGEAAALVDKHDLRQKLSGCEQRHQRAHQHEMHVANCCTITIVRYIDLRDDLPAVEERQVYVSGKPDVNEFTYFRLGDDEYIVRPASIATDALQLAFTDEESDPTSL